MIKQVWSPDHICFITSSHLFYHSNTFHYLLIKLVLVPDHFVLSPDQICFITRAPSITSWSNLFYHLITFVLLPESTFHYLFIKLVLWPDHTFFTTRTPFIITRSNLFYHLITFVLSPEHFSLPLDEAWFITWSYLFYYPSTFHYLLIKRIWSPDRICFITRTPFITS